MTATEDTRWLLGCWRLHWAEPELEILPDTRMEFQLDSQLIYTICIDDKQAVFELVYRLDGAKLRTYHPDGGHAAAARVSMENDGRLQLDFDGRHAWFMRDRLM